MNKAILIIDMPENCRDCNLREKGKASCLPKSFETSLSGVYNYYHNGTKPDWCPLKALPEEKSDDNVDGFFDGYDAGWNAYRKKILGE